MPARYLQKTGVVEKQVDDEAFLASPDSPDLYHLNPTGAALWRLAKTPTTAAEAAAVLCRAFPQEDGEKISADTSAVLEDLVRHGLVERME